MTRALIAGWPSFVQGEATAGDVLSMTAVERRRVAAGPVTDSLLPELVEELVAGSDRAVARAGWGRR